MHRRYALGDLRPPRRRHLLRTPTDYEVSGGRWLWWWIGDVDWWSWEGPRRAFDARMECRERRGGITA